MAIRTECGEILQVVDFANRRFGREVGNCTNMADFNMRIITTIDTVFRSIGVAINISRPLTNLGMNLVGSPVGNAGDCCVIPIYQQFITIITFGSTGRYFFSAVITEITFFVLPPLFITFWMMQI